MHIFEAFAFGYQTDASHSFAGADANIGDQANVGNCLKSYDWNERGIDAVL